MTNDFTRLAVDTFALAEALDTGGAIGDSDRSAIIDALTTNAAAFEDIANGAGDDQGLGDVGLREFYDCWKPLRSGRQVTALEPKKGPLDLAETWMRVQSKGHGAKLSDILSLARKIAAMWTALTPEREEVSVPDEFSIGRVMGPSSRGEGDDEKTVYETVKRSDLTSHQAAQLKIDARPPDFTAAQDARLQGLVYALVQAVRASEEPQNAA